MLEEQRVEVDPAEGGAEARAQLGLGRAGEAGGRDVGRVAGDQVEGAREGGATPGRLRAPRGPELQEVRAPDVPGEVRRREPGRGGRGRDDLAHALDRQLAGPGVGIDAEQAPLDEAPQPQRIRSGAGVRPSAPPALDQPPGRAGQEHAAAAGRIEHPRLGGGRLQAVAGEVQDELGQVPGGVDGPAAPAALGREAALVLLGRQGRVGFRESGHERARRRACPGPSRCSTSGPDPNRTLVGVQRRSLRTRAAPPGSPAAPAPPRTGSPACAAGSPGASWPCPG